MAAALAAGGGGGGEAERKTTPTEKATAKATKVVASTIKQSQSTTSTKPHDRIDAQTHLPWVGHGSVHNMRFA